MRSAGAVFRSSLTCTATFAVCAACTPPPAANVEPTSAAEPPDLSGVWMAFAVENPDGGGNAVRYSAEGQAMLDAFASQFSSIPETGAWCYGTGMPSVMLSTVSYPIEIVQHASRLVMLAELEMQVRRVYLDGRPHPEDYLSSGVGHSVGTWDGDTLVIDTTLLSEWQLRPWPRTEQTQIVERVHLTKLGDITARATGFVAERREADQRRRARGRDDVDRRHLRGPTAAHRLFPAHVRHRHARVRVLGRTLARRNLRKIECLNSALAPSLRVIASIRALCGDRFTLKFSYGIVRSHSARRDWVIAEYSLHFSIG